MLANAGINILGLSLQCRRSISIVVSRRVSTSFQWFSTDVQANCFDDPPVNVTDFFQRLGCSNDVITKIFTRNPAMVKYDVNNLRDKLNSLHEIGVSNSDLVKIIARCPRFFCRRFDDCLLERAQFLDSLFGSRKNMLRVIVKDPSILRYDIEKHIKPCLALYESVGVSPSDLSLLIHSRPTIILRSSLNAEKLACINRSGLSQNSKVYKYFVSIIAVTRLETIYRKGENLQKFGFSFEEVMSLCGRCPFILTMSEDRVQRNMTYVTGTMKLPENIVLSYPQLLCMSLDRLLKPRFRLAEKITAMGLKPQIEGTLLMRAFRMKESTFMKFFISCHEKKIAACLMDYYDEVKDFKRLGETSKVPIPRRYPY